MTLQTKDISSRRSAVEELKQKHLMLFEEEGIEKAKFIPKMAYVPKTGAERIIALFPSEIMGGEDIYTEFVSKQNVPEDPERTLWKWEFNPDFETAYEKSEPHPATNHRRYLIPVTELINVVEARNKKLADNPEAATPEEVQPELDFVEPTVEKKPPMLVDSIEELDDAPLTEMTIKDRAAIEWKMPVSDKDWLNELIKDNFKETKTITPK
jgi:hypothetical protein